MKKWIPITALIFCCMIWGTTFVVVKDVSTKIDPYLLSIIRNLIAVIVILPIILITKKWDSLKNTKAIKYGFITGLFLGAIYVIQTIGIRFTSSNHSAFITCSSVIIVPIMLILIGRQRITKQQIFSIVLISIGMFYLTKVKSNENYNVGDIITFIGAFFCAAHIILSGHFVRKTDFLGLIFYQFFFACIISIIGLVINTKITGNEIIFKETAINDVLYLGFLGSLFCFFITVWAQKHVSTMYTAMIFSLEPIFATTTSYFYSGELFTQTEIVGAIGIFTGLIFYSIPLKKTIIKSHF